MNVLSRSLNAKLQEIISNVHLSRLLDMFTKGQKMLVSLGYMHYSKPNLEQIGYMILHACIN